MSNSHAKFIERSENLCKAFKSVLVVTVKPDVDILTGQNYTQFYSETNNGMIKWFNESHVVLKKIAGGTKTLKYHRSDIEVSVSYCLNEF